jgi:hypothetical protein
VLERIIARHEIKLVALQPSCANPTGADLSPTRHERLLDARRYGETAPPYAHTPTLSLTVSALPASPEAVASWPT